MEQKPKRRFSHRNRKKDTETPTSGTLGVLFLCVTPQATWKPASAFLYVVGKVPDLNTKTPHR
nr:MAG TPA: hypothetical protein [Caudoviricetes sp.]